MVRDQHNKIQTGTDFYDYFKVYFRPKPFAPQLLYKSSNSLDPMTTCKSDQIFILCTFKKRKSWKFIPTETIYDLYFLFCCQKCEEVKDETMNL